MALVLFFMTLGSLATSITLSAQRRPYATSGRYYVAAGLITGLGVLGFMFSLVDWAWLFAFLVGVGCAMTFIGAIALPPVLADSSAAAAGYSGVSLTVGYIFAFGGPILSGWIVDGTATVAAGFIPLVPASVLVIWLGGTMPGRRPPPSSV